MLCLARAAAADDWKFAASYPQQLEALETTTEITIDGVLDDACWADSKWAVGFEDIAQPLYPTAEVPAAYQTRARGRAEPSPRCARLGQPSAFDR